MLRPRFEYRFTRNESFDSVEFEVGTRDLVSPDMVYTNQCFVRFSFDL